jgi:predicted dithiol-disulfide oxidoreductase (DUF899 family)
MEHKIVSQEEWNEARRRLLAKEKEFTRQRDALSQERRELPWVRVDKTYVFDGPKGKETLAQLFDGCSQLIVQHVMFDPAWEAACKSCSFWADNFEHLIVHLRQRDVMLVAVSRAPLAKLEAFKRRMGWTFKWVSSGGNEFNQDYHVTATPQERASGEIDYNYEKRQGSFEERPGISVFYKAQDGTIYHTYSCYARGLDMMNAAYQYLDLVPKGRDEAGLSYPMEWVRLRDSYGS